ncbi:cobyrinate a,c-diamide synthase [Pseudoruegeria sp. SK021]|uniref:cobyrinate a,c-diamide synthase n=1 Tax=Pseudoruegeria sp. SK021 TaxID=1933035 RepID=UPI000A23BBC2|nr:cobyrinate a,c-diamide synthase [Pseudoruegeria sp. SK021]OSP54280.1 cobyrinic acid a,c-diamide synthase [Pseudoruegeria sp. SK021]
MKPADVGRGLILAAPSSGSGKTTVTLGLLRALARRGLDVRGAKSGPDYIDPRFLEAASAAPCLNLDAWAMSPARLSALAAGPGLLVIEGAMGLFDGAPPDGRGATADLARHLRLPVLLIVDAARMAQSVAPLVAGFARFDPTVQIAGVILNRVGSPRHDAMLRRALAPLGLPVLGALPRLPDLATPSRHLGLVQATERPDIARFLDLAADQVAAHLDLDQITALAAPLAAAAPAARMPPPAQTIAIAQDTAFGFAYPHLLADWRAAGASLMPFSPLANDPVPPAEFVFLPGGYPELHAGPLAAAERFLSSLRHAASAGSIIYGECGGYMTLGHGLIDANGTRHRMAGLLNLETSFAARKLHLGYRHLRCDAGPLQGHWTGHEFHYATTMLAQGTPLFSAWDATGATLPDMGLRDRRVMGSFAHVIDCATAASFHATEPGVDSKS